MPRSAGLILVVIGVAIALLGLLAWAGALGWFGRLPGDIRIEGERTTVYVPIVSMLLVSVVLSIVVTLLRRFL